MRTGVSKITVLTKTNPLKEAMSSLESPVDDSRQCHTSAEFL